MPETLHLWNKLKIKEIDHKGEEVKSWTNICLNIFFLSKQLVPQALSEYWQTSVKRLTGLCQLVDSLLFMKFTP